jgi:chromosome partitioning protein
MHLAAVAESKGKPVVVLDADNERSALEWAATGDLKFAVERANPDGMARQARSLENESGVVIIDGPPNSRDLLWAAASVADHVVVPISPTGLDVNRLRSTIEVLLDIEASKENLDTRILFTRWDGRKLLAREASEVLQEFPVMNSRIRALTRYEASFGTMPDYLDEYKDVWEELSHG